MSCVQVLTQARGQKPDRLCTTVCVSSAVSRVVQFPPSGEVCERGCVHGCPSDRSVRPVCLFVFSLRLQCHNYVVRNYVLVYANEHLFLTMVVCVFTCRLACTCSRNQEAVVHSNGFGAWLLVR